MAGSVTAPKIPITVAACEYSEWRRFAPFHYLTSNLARSARTFAAYVDDRPVAFAGFMARPVSRGRNGPVQNLTGLSRVVTLPDWQGLGIAFVLIEACAGAYATIGRRVHSYPAHPALIRSFDRSPHWAMIAKPGFSMSQRGGTDRGRRAVVSGEGWGRGWNAGSRPCAVFRYVGPDLDRENALLLLRPYLK